MRTIYFDYNATTPLDPQVRESMLPFLGEVYGNPSSVHQVGRRARALLDEARYRVSALWKCKPSEVIFTSGGTESNNLAIFGTARLLRDKGRHLITSTIEHHAALHCFDYLEKKEGFTVTRVPVSAAGKVSPEDVAKAIRPDTTLVSIMAANNEIGTLQPVAEIGNLCKKHGIIFHTDAVQMFGKEPITTIHQFHADLVSVCAHKFHGPKGAGALFVKSPFLPDPILFGGGHENERRAGTENLAAIYGLVTALEQFTPKPIFDRSFLAPLRDSLAASAETIEGVNLRGFSADNLANTVSFSVNGCDSIGLMAGLDMEGVCASSGSACSAGSLEPSHVLLALGVSAAEANSLVRFSLGRETTISEVAAVRDILPLVIKRIRGH